MYSPSSSVRKRFGHHRRQIGRGSEGRALAPCRDGPDHSPRFSFSALLIKKLCQFTFRKFVHQVGRRRAAAPVHAHVERALGAKTEAPLRGLQLRRRDSEIEENSPVDRVPALFLATCFQFSEISLFPSKTLRPSGLQRPGRLCSFTVLVQPEDHRPFLQQRARMTAAPKRPVYPSLPRLHLCRREHLGQEHRDMSTWDASPRPPFTFHICHDRQLIFQRHAGASAGRFSPTNSKALRRASLTTEEPTISPAASFSDSNP